MYKISEFAFLCGTTAKTIRFYDNAGILKADYVDMSNGYRYYSKDKLPQYYKIISLKQIGFTIDEIRSNFLDATDDEILTLLRKKAQALSDAYENCKKVISQYEERVKMYNESNHIRVNIKCDKEKNIVFLDNGINSTAVYCTPENIYDCYSILNDILDVDGIVNIDLKDLCAINISANPVTMGYGYAEGVNKGVTAVEQAAKSIVNAKAIIIFFEVSKETPLSEIENASQTIIKYTDENATIIWGASFTEDKCDSIRVTIIKF
jgi:DNA-binding transcriptional MerR regulator